MCHIGYTLFHPTMPRNSIGIKPEFCEGEIPRLGEYQDGEQVMAHSNERRAERWRGSHREGAVVMA
jgi:hypothetical protein